MRPETSNHIALCQPLVPNYSTVSFFMRLSLCLVDKDAFCPESVRSDVDDTQNCLLLYLSLSFSFFLARVFASANPFDLMLKNY